MVELNWGLLQAIFYHYAQVGQPKVKRFFLDFELSHLVREDGLIDAMKGVCTSQLVAETPRGALRELTAGEKLSYKDFVHVLIFCAMHGEGQADQVEEGPPTTWMHNLLAHLSAHAHKKVVKTTWLRRLSLFHQQSKAFVSDQKRVGAVSQAWQFFSASRPTDRSDHVYCTDPEQASREPEMASPRHWKRGPPSARKEWKSYSALRANPGQFDGVMPLRGFKGFLKSCRLPKNAISGKEIKAIFNAAANSNSELGFDNFLFALVHVARISFNSDSAFTAFCTLIEKHVMLHADKYDPNSPMDHPRKANCTPADTHNPQSGRAAYWPKFSDWASSVFQHYEESVGITMDSILSYYGDAQAQADRLTAAQLYALVSDMFAQDQYLASLAKEDIEHLLQSHAQRKGASEPFTASRHDFMRILMRLAEEESRRHSETNEAGMDNPRALWTILTKHVQPAIRALLYDPMMDRLEADPEYSFPVGNGWL